MINPESGRENVKRASISPEQLIQFKRVVSEKGLTINFMRALLGWTEEINNFVVGSGVVKTEDSPRVFLQKLPLWHSFAGSTLNPDTNFPPLTEDELVVAEEVEKRITTFVEKFKEENEF